MIDLHCHILPGIDDGPATLAESLALARAAVAGGTTAVAATAARLLGILHGETLPPAPAMPPRPKGLRRLRRR